MLRCVHLRRSTFIFLAVCCGVMVPLLVMVPETQQHLVLTRLRKSDPHCVKSVAQAQQVLSHKPTFLPPWTLLKYLVEPGIAPYALLNSWTLATLFATLTEWPLFVAQPPYGLSQTMIGVSYLCIGVAMLIGSPLGGKLSDITAARWLEVPEGRMLFNLVAALLLMPVGAVIYGWCLHAQVMLVGPLVGHFVVGLANSLFNPGLYSYVSSAKQANAGAASAVLNASMFSMSGVLVLVSVPGVDNLGVGPFFTLLAGIQAALGLVAGACIWRAFKRVRAATGTAAATSA